MSVDVNQQIGRLPAANTRPVSVKPNEALDHAVAIMLLNDFSQLPVMTTDREVKGIVSWKSIGHKLALKQDCKSVQDCLVPHESIKHDRPIREAIPIILKRDCVLIRDGSRAVIGIITAADICLQYEHLSGPFLLLGEIESHLRRLIGDKLTIDDLATAKHTSDVGRVINGVADLTLGEAVRLLKDPKMWEKLGLALDRNVFSQKLDDVRKIRNCVMHFHPGGISDEKTIELAQFAAALRVLLAVCR
jgi:hypothetical protein